MKFELIIFIASEGENTSFKYLEDTIMSVEHTIDKINYKYYFMLSEKQEKVITSLLKNSKLNNNSILKVCRASSSWACDYNKFLNDYGNDTKYIMIMHDDLQLETNNFFSKTLSLTKDREDIGWIKFTNRNHYINLEKPWSVSARVGFSKDRKKFPYTHECHNFDKSFEGRVSKNLHLIDMPETNKLVKIHAPYSDLILVSSNSMKKIGLCEDWGPYTLLVDEDWGLEALRKNLWNVWISDIFYLHPTNMLNRKRKGHKGVKQSHKKFYEKWRFYYGSDYCIKDIKEEFKNTLIPWTSYYYTYDWKYL